MSMSSQLFNLFNASSTTEIYTLSLHDALPICPARSRRRRRSPTAHRSGGTSALQGCPPRGRPRGGQDRKSTRLNSSHSSISYAVFCLKKKNLIQPTNQVNVKLADNARLPRMTL